MHAKSRLLLQAAETSAKSLEALEDGVTCFVILAADLPDCLADFLLGGMT